MSDLVANPEGYSELLKELKAQIRAAQVKAALAVNGELVQLYWRIGQEILVREDKEGWGAKVIEQLSRDLQRGLPGTTGLSPRNLRYMRDLAREWPDPAIVPQLVAKLPWGHNRTLLDKLKSHPERQWYAEACIKNGWSRNVLSMQIETGLHKRQGNAITNFERTLPAPQSALAQQLIKDPYNLEFLTLTENAHERHLEQGLMDHLQKFLLELGVGFAFLGRQYRLQVGAKEYFLDLLFYHTKLRCHVVIELKVVDFDPAFVGTLNFYLSAVDDLLRHTDDQPTIGILLCRGKAAWSPSTLSAI